MSEITLKQAYQAQDEVINYLEENYDLNRVAIGIGFDPKTKYLIKVSFIGEPPHHLSKEIADIAQRSGVHVQTELIGPIYAFDSNDCDPVFTEGFSKAFTG